MAVANFLNVINFKELDVDPSSKGTQANRYPTLLDELIKYVADITAQKTSQGTDPQRKIAGFLTELKIKRDDTWKENQVRASP